jgi:hypothetical protein
MRILRWTSAFVVVISSQQGKGHAKIFRSPQRRSAVLLVRLSSAQLSLALKPIMQDNAGSRGSFSDCSSPLLPLVRVANPLAAPFQLRADILRLLQEARLLCEFGTQSTRHV